MRGYSEARWCSYWLGWRRPLLVARGGDSPEPVTVVNAAERFETAYNSGDPGALLDLLADGVISEINTPDSFERLGFDELETRQEWAVALNEQLTLQNCRRASVSRVVCAASRSDNLVLATAGAPWLSETTLRIENGKIVEWHESQFGLPEYQSALSQFGQWLELAQPLAPTLLGDPTWLFEQDSETAAQLVDLFAESEGVSLE